MPPKNIPDTKGTKYIATILFNTPLEGGLLMKELKHKHGAKKL